jgi:chemotaxis response regulator CheB
LIGGTMAGKILLVDDAAFMRMMLKKIIAPTGNYSIDKPLDFNRK